MLTILILFLILSPLVLIHEFGHFIVARKFGIKVEEFGFGFPPKLLSFKKGETVYSINLIPFGGFVKLFGEDEAGGGKIKIKGEEPKTKDLERAFFAKPASQRALVVLAGVIMNTLLAFVIFYAFLSLSNFKTTLPLIGNYQFSSVNQTNYNLNEKDLVISQVAQGSPAEKAGIKPPVRVISVNGQKPNDTEELINIVNENKGKEITLEWQNVITNQRASGELVPRVSPPENEGALGVGFFPIALLSYDTPIQRAFSGITHSYNLTAYNLDIIGKLIALSFQERSTVPIGQGVSGPIGLGVIVAEILKIPNLKEIIIQLLNLAGLITITLAFFNVLPIPALDGGRLFFIVIEMIIGKKVNPKYEAVAHTIFFILLIALMVVVTVKDVRMFFLR